ncbi:ATP-binding protein [Roseateles sp. GG27B]
MTMTHETLATAPPVSPTLRLSLPVRLDSLELARQALADFLLPLDLSQQAQFNLELILEETLMNVVLHAFKDSCQHWIELSVQAEPDALLLCFEDEGVAFDPVSAAEPQRPGSISEAAIGGLGLMLVRQSAKSVTYLRANGRNRLSIAIHRQ